MTFVACHTFCFVGVLAVIGWDIYVGNFWWGSLPCAAWCFALWADSLKTAIRKTQEGKEKV